MPVISPDCQIDLTVSDTCDALKLTDSTGLYPTAAEGYGLPSGPAVNDVDTVIITDHYSSLNTDIVFTFTVVSGTITAASLEIGGTTTTDILASLSSTTWPFTDFNLNGDYGVTLPTFEDEVRNITYNIIGLAGVVFDFSFSFKTTVDCAVTCCMEKKFIDLDLECACNDNAATINALFVNAAILQSTYNSSYGYTEAALTALEYAVSKCSDDCGCA